MNATENNKALTVLNKQYIEDIQMFLLNMSFIS